MSKSQKQRMEAIQEEQQAERDFKEEMELLKGAQAQDDTPRQIRRDLVEDIKNSPLSEPSGEVLKNLLSPDFILAYYSSKEVEELKHMLRLKKMQFMDMHPAQECEVVGSDRAYVNDDPKDTLTPLTDAQYLVADAFFKGVYARITRAKDMKQQEIFQTSIRENRLGPNNQRADGGGGGGGLVGRIRRS